MPKSGEGKSKVKKAPIKYDRIKEFKQTVRRSLLADSREGGKADQSRVTHGNNAQSGDYTRTKAGVERVRAGASYESQGRALSAFSKEAKSRLSAGTPAAGGSRSAAAKKGWATRKAKGGAGNRTASLPARSMKEKARG